MNKVERISRTALTRLRFPRERMRMALRNLAVRPSGYIALYGDCARALQSATVMYGCEREAEVPRCVWKTTIPRRRATISLALRSRLSNPRPGLGAPRCSRGADAGRRFAFYTTRRRNEFFPSFAPRYLTKRRDFLISYDLSLQFYGNLCKNLQYKVWRKSIFLIVIIRSIYKIYYTVQTYRYTIVLTIVDNSHFYVCTV